MISLLGSYRNKDEATRVFRELQTDEFPGQ